jgi:flagellar protein FliS
MSYQNVAATYRQNAILTASPEKIVKLLYDGAIRHLERSRIALSDPATRNVALAGESLSKAMGILGELRSCLDHEIGGEVTANLDRLYEFGIDQISQANMKREPQPVENTLKVMRTLKEAWDAVIPG